MPDARTTEAHVILRSAAYDQASLKRLIRSFDNAWSTIAGDFQSDTDGAAQTCQQLARIIVSLHEKLRDSDRIASMALEIIIIGRSKSARVASKGVSIPLT
jgi:hypothetical protein